MKTLRAQIENTEMKMKELKGKEGVKEEDLEERTKNCKVKFNRSGKKKGKINERNLITILLSFLYTFVCTVASQNVFIEL